MNAALTGDHVVDWLSRYERAWRSSGTEQLGELFTEDASYRMSPYEPVHSGLEAIGELWEGERYGPDEAFTMASELVAVDGDTAVARVEVSYGEPKPHEYVDLWVIRFAADGRCAAFEEWPYWPDHPSSSRDR